ncbi:MAG: HTTM domain-containing protein [Bacteroidota bacterium]
MLRSIEANQEKSPEPRLRAFPFSIAGLRNYLHQPTSSAPLAVFRIIFGLMMLASMIRFAAKGWIDKLYIQPSFHFSYYGFEWVQPLGQWTYLLFLICGISALMVALGWQYRWAIITFFLSFTYIELMDKTTYLNHYYFISLMSFLLIFLPANASFSVDAARNAHPPRQQVPRWTIDAIKLLLCIVYFYAGLAKLNSDWLLHAMPLKIWLPSKYGIPILGDLLQKEWVAYAFAWGGTFYDLFIPFLLLHRRTRPLAFVMVVFFHAMTALLFPIGMFPWIMMLSALIFFDAKWHEKVLHYLSKVLLPPKGDNPSGLQNHIPLRRGQGEEKKLPKVLILFFIIQILLPWRYLAYPGELFWTEEGFRFSWRVMLMEKAGYANFKIVDQASGKRFYVDNTDFLTAFQEKQMATQPDFILEYAHYLGEYFTAQWGDSLAVYVESYVALNGRPSRPYIDPTVNLMEIAPSFRARNWILDFDDEIKGL